MLTSKTSRVLMAFPLLLLAAACGQVDDATSPEIPAGTSSPTEIVLGGGATGWGYTDLQEFAPGFTYELALSGQVDLSTGGVVEGRPATWPDDTPYFSYTVLPGAIETASLADPNADTVDIKVWVPIFESLFPGPDFPLPLVLEPHGLTYLPGQYATLALANHPALAPVTLDSRYDFYCIDGDLPEGVTPGEVTTIADPEAQAAYDRSTRIRASVMHHSRWVVAKDGDDED